MKIISIVNNKGGVGKTTSAVNIAYYLSIKGLKTLLIDADPQGNATSYLLNENKSTMGTFFDAYKKDSIKEFILETGRKNLYILPANMSLGKAEIEMLSIINKDSKMKKLLKQIENNFDIVIIDTAPNLSVLTINSLVASNSIYIPVKVGGFEFDGIRNVLEILEQIKEINPSINAKAFFTQFDGRNSLNKELSTQIKEQIQKEFECDFLNSYIRNNIKLSESILSNESIFEYDKNSNGSIDYKNLAEEILIKEGL